MSIFCLVSRKNMSYICTKIKCLFWHCYWRVTQDNIFNSWKLMVNFIFTVNPWIQWYCLLLVLNVSRYKVKWSTTNDDINVQQPLNYLKVAYHYSMDFLMLLPSLFSTTFYFLSLCASAWEKHIKPGLHKVDVDRWEIQ